MFIEAEQVRNEITNSNMNDNTKKYLIALMARDTAKFAIEEEGKHSGIHVCPRCKTLVSCYMNKNYVTYCEACGQKLLPHPTLTAGGVIK